MYYRYTRDNMPHATRTQEIITDFFTESIERTTMSGEYERLVESSGSPSPRTAREQPPPGTPSPARERLPQRLSVGSLNTDQSSPDNQVILSSVVKGSLYKLLCKLRNES